MRYINGWHNLSREFSRLVPLPRCSWIGRNKVQPNILSFNYAYTVLHSDCISGLRVSQHSIFLRLSLAS